MNFSKIKSLLFVASVWALCGCIALYSLNLGAAQIAAESPSAILTNDEALIRLNVGQLSVNSEAAQKLQSETLNFEGKRLHLVKFRGAIQADWVEQLKRNGLQIVDFIPANAYLVRGAADDFNRLRTVKTADDAIVWDGEFLPEFKIQPSARAIDDAHQAFTVQLVKDDTDNAATINLLETIKTAGSSQRQDVLHYVNLNYSFAAANLSLIAARPDVISIGARYEPQKTDERQARIVSGFLTGGVPTNGDHLAFLASQGFTQAQFDASNFAINISDSGIDQATTAPTHFGLFRLGDPAGASRIAYNRTVGTPGADAGRGCGGHGMLNANIAAGYVPSGAPFDNAFHADAGGLRYGLGVAPFVKVGGSTIFDPQFTEADFPTLEATAYRDGARISSNSWRSTLGTGEYDVLSQFFDAVVRDARPNSLPVALQEAGNQEHIVVFSAGNSGLNGANTISAPGTGKNVITVGASENSRTFGGSDNCVVPDSEADSAEDVWGLSSRGATDDGRFKPDVLAPGSHVTGGVTQTTSDISLNPLAGDGEQNGCFTGGGVCGGAGNQKFVPSNARWYTSGSGTSHSTPAVAGGAALVRQHFINQGLNPPSPAMTKAVLISSAAYMTGLFANDTLPSNNQGMGRMNLAQSFAYSNFEAFKRDQTAADLFTASGQERVFNLVITDGGKPVRVSLAWTDPPGSTVGDTYINNLNLSFEVVNLPATYLGNNFSGAFSITGGTADVRNNIESVFIPAGTFPSGTTVTLRITAANIAGDGVPGNASALDQDFALLGYNLSTTTAANAFITGKAVDASGNPIHKARLTLIDTATNQKQIATTNAFGNYQFADVASGSNYALSIAHKRFNFTPSTILLNVNANITNADFVAIP